MVGLVLLERGFTPHPPPTPKFVVYHGRCAYLLPWRCAYLFIDYLYEAPPPLSTHHPHRSTHLQSRSKSAFRKLYGLSI